MSETASIHPAEADRNLLFGVLALQTALIDNAQFAEVCSAWTTRKQTPLGDLLRERGWITAEEHQEIVRLAQRHLQRHGTAQASLAQLTGDYLRQSLGSVADADLQKSLTVVTPIPAQALTSTVTYQPTTRSRYTVLRLHAKGGLGQVWLARDEDLGRDVALKEILPGRANESNTRARFLEEARVTGQLEHPGIVPVYELVRSGSGQEPFYTMRFIRGRTLSDAVGTYHQHRQAGTAGPLELRDLLGSFISICQAIAYAHSRGVIHRDLKGQNVVLGDFGEVMVLDWGLAKVQGKSEGPADLPPVTAEQPGSRDQTVQGQVLGTPAYMSPEQAEGRLDRLDQRSDVYGLGAILYEILTGQPPFTGPDTLTVLELVIKSPPTPPRARVATIAAALEAVCLKALAKQPALRYARASDLAQEVQRYLADEPVEALREGPLTRLARWGRQHRSLTVGAAALLVTTVVALAVGLLVVNREKDRTAAERDRAEQALAAEAKARQRTRLALDEMSSQVVENWLARQGRKLEPAQEKFLHNALAYYRDFSEEAGDSEEVRKGVADAHRRVGTIEHKLGQFHDAEDAYRRAVTLYKVLAADFPDRPEYRREQAGASHNLGVLFWDTGKPKEAETAYQEALALRRQLVEERAADPTYRQDLASSYTVLANLYANTSRPQQADEAYRSALALQERLVAEDPSRPEYRRDLAVTQYNWSLELDKTGHPKEAEKQVRAAVATRRQLVAEFPKEPKYQRDLAVALTSLGTGLRDAGQIKDAEANLREAVALVKQLAADYPTVTEYRQELAASDEDLAILLVNSDRVKEAEAPFRDALALRRQLAEDFPASVKFRLDLTYSQNNMGVYFYQTGRLKEAEAMYRDAIAILQQLAAEYPRMPNYRYGLALKLFNLSLLLQQVERWQDAEKASRESVALLKQLAADFSKVPAYRKDLAKSYSGLAAGLVETGSLAEAETTYREALALHQKLVDQFPKQPEYRQEWAVVGHNLSVVLGKADRPQEAEKAERDALALREKLVTEFAENPHYRKELADSLVHLAQLARDRREFVPARELLDRARPHLEAALKSNPDYDIYRSASRTFRSVLATCLAGQGDARAAVETAEQISRLGWDPAIDLYEAAAALARCATVVEKDKDLPESKRQELAGSYADKALALLRQAIAKGYKNAARLREEMAFTALRERKEFQQLVADLEK
jgi:serine/threonine-protein kinase